MLKDKAPPLLKKLPQKSFLPSFIALAGSLSPEHDQPKLNSVTLKNSHIKAAMGSRSDGHSCSKRERGCKAWGSLDAARCFPGVLVGTPQTREMLMEIKPDVFVVGVSMPPHKTSP